MSLNLLMEKLNILVLFISKSCPLHISYLDLQLYDTVGITVGVLLII